MKLRIKIGVACLLVLSSIPAYLGAENQIPWDPSKPVKLGAGIDLALFGMPKRECLNYQASFETAGAASTSAEINILDSFESLIDDLNYGVDYSVGSKAEWAKIKAGGKTTIQHKFERFRSKSRSSLHIVVKASADFGKYLAENYELKGDFKKNIDDGEFAKFAAACGTHMIVGQRRQSQVALVITISNLTEDTKRLISNAYSNKASFSGGMDGLAVAAESDLKATWSELIKTAKRYGKISASIESTGDKGIKVLEVLAPALIGDLKTIVDKLAAYAGQFDQISSAVTHYLLLNNSVFGAPIPDVDYDSLVIVNGLFNKIVKIDDAITSLEELEKSQPQIFKSYYSADLQTLKVVRDTIVSRIESCLRLSNCQDYKDILPSFHPLDDFIIEDSLFAECEYDLYPTILADGTKSSTKILGNIRIYLSGNIRMPSEVQFKAAKVYAVVDDGIKQVKTFNGLTVRYPKAVQSGLVATIENFRFDTSKYVVVDGNNTTIKRDLLIDARTNALESNYIIIAKLKNSAIVTDYLRYPVVDDCPVVR